ncbi:MAG: PqqD family protein [Thermoanaerobaculia bacterium]|nr:PqqD family protein [Thermoanaerobaculia bacterium]
MDDSAVPRRPAELLTEVLDDELLLYHPGRTRIVALNPTASLIYSLCDGTRSVGAIRKLLAAAYPEAAERIPEEVGEAVELLVREGALDVADGDGA